MWFQHQKLLSYSKPQSQVRTASRVLRVRVARPYKKLRKRLFVAHFGSSLRLDHCVNFLSAERTQVIWQQHVCKWFKYLLKLRIYFFTWKHYFKNSFLFFSFANYYYDFIILAHIIDNIYLLRQGGTAARIKQTRIRT